MTKSIILLDYTGEWLESHINKMGKDHMVVQILPTSEMRRDQKTGLVHRDYLLVYKAGA